MSNRSYGVVKQICISSSRGTQKTPVEKAVLRKDWGLEGDAHAGNWHRQISLISEEKIKAFREQGAQVLPGAFGENIIVSGIDFSALEVGTHLLFGKGLETREESMGAQEFLQVAELEMTQVGKECHSHCAIFQQMGDCIMPREGVFARVIEGGEIYPGMQVCVVPPKEDRPFTAAVITLSDKGARGERVDESGPKITGLLEHAGYQVVEQLLLPDERQALESHLIRLSDSRQVNVIFTTGGTGFSVRDITPEATIAVCDRMANGIAEAIRGYSMQITPRAMFSRAVSGIRKKTLIVNLPGSPKAVEEALEFLLPYLGHGLGVLRGSERECGR